MNAYFVILPFNQEHSRRLGFLAQISTGENSQQAIYNIIDNCIDEDCCYQCFDVESASAWSVEDLKRIIEEMESNETRF